MLKKHPFDYLPDRDLNILRGKAMAGATTPQDTLAVLNHLARLEQALDEADYDDMLGTEGWRRFCGLPEERA
jgi:hypothetical protein